jgi:hypothetical protein
VINFGHTPTRTNNWAWFKPLIASKSLVIQFEEDSATYLVYGYDPPEALTCMIWKGTVPASVITGGYSQAQNDADKTDFETNFKPYANRSIDDIPSLIIAQQIRLAGGGSANMAVNGSVTPVVFEYLPSNNYDVEITALSFLFEDVTAFVFGNNFIRSGLAQLTNGLLLEVKAADQTVTWQNMKRTRDVVEICDDFDIVAGTVNFFRARIHLPKSLRLSRAGTYAQPDFIRVTVQDNLTTFDFAEAHFQGVKL